MALSLLSRHASALRPASQLALSAKPEQLRPLPNAETAQYQQVLAVAASQAVGLVGS